MWTYNRPYKRLIPSKERIAYHAKTELYRSLNKNKLVVFTGSGLTIPYGRLTWDELFRLLVMDVDKKFQKLYLDTKKHELPMREAKHLHNVLCTALGKNSGEEIILTLDQEVSADTTMLELCGELADVLDKIENKYEINTNFLKQKTAEYFQHGLIGQFENRLKLIDGYGKGSLYSIWKNFFEDEDEEKKKEVTKVFENLRDLEKDKKILNSQWLTDKKTFSRNKIETTPWEKIYEVAESDQDVEELFRTELIPVFTLIDKQETPIDQDEWPDPIRTLSEELKINRFITLNYDTEIEKYFLSTKGFSVKENDPLATNYNKTKKYNLNRVAKYSNGFGTELTSVTLNEGMIGKLVSFSASSNSNNIDIFHLHGRTDFANDLILTEKDYQKRYLRTSAMRSVFEEGINALFGGNDVLFLGVGMSEGDLLQPLRQFVSEAHHVPDSIITLLGYDKEKTVEQKSLKLYTEFGVKSIIYKREKNDLDKRYTKLIERYHDKKNCKRKFLCKKTLNSRELVCIQSKQFNNELLNLAQGHKQWWKLWNERAGNRKIKYFDWYNDQDNDENTGIYIRQKLEEPTTTSDTDSDGNNPTLDKIVKSLAINSKDDKDQIKIQRYTGSTGIGKGTLIHKLQDYCLDDNDGKIKENYIGCFFADAKFSNEYNSVISAFSNFLTDTIDKYSENYKPETNNSFFTITEKLKQSFLDLKELVDKRKKEKEKYRILVCLSGLDKLVDNKGYGYNALHRKFFRLLHKSDEALNCPMDLILISGKPNTPIRYLSEPLQNKKKKNYQTCKLQKWNRISKTKICDRDWLPTDSESEIEAKAQKGATAGNLTDEKLGIICIPEMTPGKRKGLEKSAENNMVIHFWLRLLLNAFKIAKTDPVRQNQLLDQLNLIASRDGVEEVVSGLLDIYQEIDTSSGERTSLVYQTILRHLALFAVPVERAVLANCPEVIKSRLVSKSGVFNSEKGISRVIEPYLKTLHEFGLIIKIQTSNSKKKPDYQYTLTSILRMHLTKTMDFGRHTYAGTSFFDVSLYAVQPLDLPVPKEKDFLLVGDILQNIIFNCRSCLDSFHIHTKRISEEKAKENLKKNMKFLDSKNSLSIILRAAVNLVSETFSIGVISQLDSITTDIEYICGHPQPFEGYRRWLRCLSNVAVDLEKNEKHIRKFDPKTPLQTPLYETESAWLFNESGLVSLIQGRLYDALPLFRIAKDRLTVSFYGQPQASTTSRRIELNEAIAMTEFGKIREAQEILSMLYQRKKIKRSKNSLTANLACGYLGYCYHLQGRKVRAEELYKEALKFLGKDNKNYLRAISLFRQYLGNLYRSLDEFSKADHYINLAIDAAASSRQMDLFHHANISKARLLFAVADKGYASQAFGLLNNASAYAENMGLYKMQVHADIIRGELLMTQKQYTMSGKLLTNAIALSNKHGMRLRKIRALEIYAQLLSKRGTDQRIIDDVLSAAKKISSETGYLVKWSTDDNDLLV